MDEDAGHVAEHAAFDLLRRGVSLTLLCDLFWPMDSTSIFRAEPGETGWLMSLRSA